MESQTTSCGDSVDGGKHSLGDGDDISRGLLHTWRGYSCSVSPERILLPQPVLQMALGAQHGVVLLEGGQVYSFGDLPWKQSGVVDLSRPSLESALSGHHVVCVAAGDFHSGAVTEDGGVHMWGDNGTGQCGLSGLISVPNPTPVAVVDLDVSPSKTVAVLELACGEKHTLALSVQREVWTWGGLGAAASPTWRPHKVEQLAGRCVLQVACGASHSLALVRCLNPSSVHRPPVDKCGQCNQLLYSMMDKEDHVIISDNHSCPLGEEHPEQKCQVEVPASTRGLKTSPSEPLLSSHTSTLDNAKPSNPSFRVQDISSADLSPLCPASSSHSNLSRKNSPYPDEEAVNDYLRKLSQHTEVKTGGLTSLLPSGVSSTSTSSTINNLVASYASAVGERVASTCEALSLRKMMSLYLSTGTPRHGGVTAERLRHDDTVQTKKSCSTGDIHQEDAGSGRRRLSLPGLLSHVSPLLRRSSRPRPGGVEVSLLGLEAPEVETAVSSLQTEVWSWGSGQEGQLGHGDNLDRLQPCCIRSLANQDVVVLTAGAYHSVALTAQCQVYSWGCNKFGQLGHMESPTTVPRLAKLSEGVRVWDVSAGQKHTVLLADGDCMQPIIYYSGQQVEQVEQQAGGYTQQPVLLPFCMNLGYVSSVCAGGQHCAALSDRNMMGFISSLHELAAAERKLYCKLWNIKNHVLRPLLELDSLNSVLGSSSLGLLQTLSGCLHLVCHLSGRHAASLTSNLRRSRQVNHLMLLECTDLFLDTYTDYCAAVGHFQVMGGFHALVKPSLEIFSKSPELLQKLSECVEDNTNMADQLVALFYLPASHLQEYARLLLKLASCFEVCTTEHQKLHQTYSRVESCRLQLLRKKKDSDYTLHFWKSFPGKMTDSLKKPQRRLLCESSNKTVTLQNAGRFSVNWFILFNDALVHAQFSTHHIFPVATLWVEVLPEEEAGYGLKVITPEETFTLLASSSSEKIKWLRSLNQAVEEVLRVEEQDLSGPKQVGEGGTPGQKAEPPASRTASYTFYKEGRLKDATYEGRWLNGKPNGRGILKWPDGSIYTGDFYNGLEDGLGNFVAPNKLHKMKDRYEGQWKEGRMHGWGTYSYASGEVYEGWFQDGLRHGHGVLRSGRLTSSSPSVFVGQWQQDKRTGYGVLDDITKGEKFMGMWQDHLKQGAGVVVTQFGLYYEGSFKDNRMMGTGILLSEDDTIYEGDFCDDWTLNGKGVLTMASGDYLEGSFTGLWGSGLKVTGSYFKPHLFDSDKDKTRAVKLGRLCVGAEDKWQHVFDECWKQLDGEEAGRGVSGTRPGSDTIGPREMWKQPGCPGENLKAWENMAVALTCSPHSPQLSSRSHSRSLESLEAVPQQEGPFSMERYHAICLFLLKACDSPLHPLGRLVESLVAVYRMTYVGVGANRRLLPQAVQEIKSYLQRMFHIIRCLFPDLPEEGGVIPETPGIDSNKSSNSLQSTDPGSAEAPLESPKPNQVVSSWALLLPVLLPRLYPPLFTLYALDKEKEDDLYWERVLRLNKQTDLALLAFLGVQQKFWPVSISAAPPAVPSQSAPPAAVSPALTLQVVSSSKDVCFTSAVETLQQISTTFTPSDKLHVIQLTFEEITQEVQVLLKHDFLWSMDDLFPVFLYVVLRARIRNLGSEVNLMEDLMDPCIQHGEHGIMFTTLKACYYQIQHEKIT